MRAKANRRTAEVKGKGETLAIFIEIGFVLEDDRKRSFGMSREDDDSASCGSSLTFCSTFNVGRSMFDVRIRPYA